MHIFIHICKDIYIRTQVRKHSHNCANDTIFWYLPSVMTADNKKYERP